MRVDHSLATRQLSRSEAVDRRPDDQPAASVWLREMEKAQAQMWFTGPTWREGQATAAGAAQDGRSLTSSRTGGAPQLPGPDAHAHLNEMPLKMSAYAHHSVVLPRPQVHHAIEARHGGNEHRGDAPRLTGEPRPVPVMDRTERAADPQQDRQSPMTRHSSGPVDTAQSALHLDPALPAARARPAVAPPASEAKQVATHLPCSRSAAPAAPDVTAGARTPPVQPHARAMNRPAELVRRTHPEAVDTEPATSRPSARTPVEPQQSLRLHAEWHGDEIHVWVGKDGRVNLSHAQLRRWVDEALVPARLRLAGLVCNGKPIAIDCKPVSRGPSCPDDEQLTQDRGASRWPT